MATERRGHKRLWSVARGIAFCVALLWLGYGPYNLIQGLQFHSVDRGPGTISQPYHHVIHGRGSRTVEYGGVIRVASNGETVRVKSTDEHEPIWVLLNAHQGRTLPVSDIVFDTATGGLVSFRFGTHTYHLVLSGNHDEITGIVQMVTGPLILVALWIAWRRRRRREERQPLEAPPVWVHVGADGAAVTRHIRRGSSP